MDMTSADGMIGKIKNKAQKAFSIEFNTLDNVSKKASRYGYTIGSGFDKVESDKINFRVEDHIFSTEKLNKIDGLLNGSGDFHLSDNLSNQIKNPDKGIEDIYKQIIEEAKSNNVDLKGQDKDTQRLYATAKLAEHMGAQWKTEYVNQGNHRKKLIVEIDPDNPEFPAEQQINMVMKSLGISSPTMIDAAINRFNKTNEHTLQNPTSHVDHPKFPGQESDAAPMNDTLSELAQGLKGLKHADKGANNASLPNNVDRSTELGK